MARIRAVPVHWFRPQQSTRLAGKFRGARDLILVVGAKMISEIVYLVAIGNLPRNKTRACKLRIRDKRFEAKQGKYFPILVISRLFCNTTF